MLIRRHNPPTNTKTASTAAVEARAPRPAKSKIISAMNGSTMPHATNPIQNGMDSAPSIREANAAESIFLALTSSAIAAIDSITIKAISAGIKKWCHRRIARTSSHAQAASITTAHPHDRADATNRTDSHGDCHTFTAMTLFNNKAVYTMTMRATGIPASFTTDTNLRIARGNLSKASESATTRHTERKAKAKAPIDTRLFVG